MLYLFDANVLITANNTYYAIDQVPEYWEWIQYQGEIGNIKLPLESWKRFWGVRIIRRVRRTKIFCSSGFKRPAIKKALLLDEKVDADLVNAVIETGYALDLTDMELEEIGRDPFLIAYAMGGTDRCVVTTETSAPKKQRQNRKIPDVCKTFDVECHTPFKVNRDLGFKTGWKT